MAEQQGWQNFATFSLLNDLVMNLLLVDGSEKGGGEVVFLAQKRKGENFGGASGLGGVVI